jgi:hypothetical protein
VEWQTNAKLFERAKLQAIVETSLTINTSISLDLWALQNKALVFLLLKILCTIPIVFNYAHRPVLPTVMLKLMLQG